MGDFNFTLETYIEIIVGFIGIIGGVILLMWKVLRVPMTLGNLFKPEFKHPNSDILENIEYVIVSESNRLVKQFGISVKFTETEKVTSNDALAEFLKHILKIIRRARTPEKKLTLDCSEVRVFNSLFIGALNAVILDVRHNNDCKLQIVINNKSKLNDLISPFEVLKEDSTNIEIKVLRDFYE